MTMSAILPKALPPQQGITKSETKSSGSPDSNTLRNQKAKKIACVECRQQKSKCDAHEKYPDPCTRCSKKKVPCSLQSDYKRTYKRAKFQRIEEELQELKKNLSHSGADTFLKQLKEGNSSDTQSPGSGTPLINHPQIIRALSRTETISPSTTSHFDHSSTAPTHHYQTEPSVSRDQYQPSKATENFENVQISSDSLKCTPKQFGEVELSSEQIKSLYQEFLHKYHGYLPLIDIYKGPERIYRLSPVLFWVIMSIALRHISPDILMKLAPLLKSALAEISISPITRYLPEESDEPILNVSSVYSVQAFLLYTFWPPLTSSLSADSSWNTVGIAVFQAIRLGLNGPGTNNYNRMNPKAILQEHVKTWISCNIVSQTIATAFGFPAFVSFDSSVVGRCRPGANDIIPLTLKHMVQISHFEDQMAKVLNSNTSDINGLADPVERLPLLKVLNQQYVELELRLESEGLDDVRKFQLLATRLHLFTYYFLDNARVAHFELRHGLVSLYNAALHLLSHVSSISSKDSNFIKYVPIVFILKIWQAAFVVAKLAHSSLSDIIDVAAGRQLYIVAIQLAMKASILKHDMPYRASGIMRNVWQLFKALREKTNSTNLTVTISTRMSASLFFDCLWVLRQQVGMIKLEMNQKPEIGLRNDNDDDDDDQDDVFYGENKNENNDNDSAPLDEESHPGTDPGTANSEGSANSGSNKRRPRTLSNNFNAESSARKIIRTIPLDPTPIALRSDTRQNPISPISNSPSMSRPLQSSIRDILQRQQSPDINVKTSNERTNISQVLQRGSPSAILQQQQQSRIPQFQKTDTSREATSNEPEKNSTNYISPTNIPSLDLSDDWTSDMLWHDVDSVMNDFGFNADNRPYN
ncbi:hypothetical protein WICMUC_004140 [Wickerhamomyces mucosus]|uniref:Zn(2)-C6 fungal-type domain-containing protein n=1 Tax=Wickerhamomyces mucosus TaxID=1378264 RepID=A0A9P8PK21_9ASCO|nr:hypothetical protein WICMUC_004140 [Wickerhamomyces mucosus]